MGKPFPHYTQTESKDCGPTCIKIISKYYGRALNTQQLRTLSSTTREGSSLLGLSDAAEELGLHTLGVKLSYERLIEAELPCILHWNKNHYVVLYKVKRDKLFISDPAHSLLTYTKAEFLKAWIGNNADEQTQEGIALLIDPTPRFYDNDLDEEDARFDFSFISKYLLKYKRFLVQLVIGLLVGSLFQLIVPFLTQSIVDVGIKNRDIHFIYLILLAQLFLFLGRTTLQIIRSWILLHLSARINISLISDFFIKLMNLPISFFDVKLTGDLMQRIGDHQRIEKLITTSSLSVLFSMINFLIFGLVLAYYNFQIFTVFLLGSTLYFLWVVFFFKRRKALDYKRFTQVSQEQGRIIELINGMQEIKLHNAERQMRWNWEFIQARIFKISLKSLSLEQTQSVGSSFINELKNILITVLAAMLVIEGSITLGMMMAITYIVGQLNEPIVQLISFMRDVQDARISLERLGEIHHMEDEEPLSQHRLTALPLDRDIVLKNVSFSYVGALAPVISQLDLTIAANKITAIVGGSGGGKTTLMKLLLKFYEVSEGRIFLGTEDLNNVAQKTWRAQCGVVMQEGYIFNDSIANNIGIGEEDVNFDRLKSAVEIANIRSFIEELPLSYNTKVGAEGVGLSTGQKQRLLIARAVYKNPDFLFFDEATSALDANNEKTIMEKLDSFFKGKTVVVVAHRLSTVKNADNIVVLDKGKIVEQGVHTELINQKGQYYELVKNQLELGQ